MVAVDARFGCSWLADSLHTGSISFGRFESESLSWERRSSFSHNRYLEEVEKCSKPGSVTEKKAYFEAHFKKKALLLQSSYGCHNGTEYKTCENNDYDNTEEMGYDNNESNDFVHFDESPDGSNYHGESQEMKFEYQEHASSPSYNTDYREVGNGEDSHFAYFDESAGGSDCHGECCDMKVEGEDMETSYAESQVEPASTDVDCVVDCVFRSLNPGEADQINTGGDELHLVHVEQDVDVQKNLNKEIVNGDELLIGIDLSLKSREAEKDDNLCSEHQQNPSPKLKASPEMKLTKSSLKSQDKFTMIHKDLSCEVSKDSAKILSRREERNLRTKAKKQSSQNSISTTRPTHRTLKAEESERSKSKLCHDNTSEKELRAKKVIAPQPSTPAKFESRDYQTTNRMKRTVNSTNQQIRRSSATFKFKSEERAEKRKEFYMKLEKKMHAKETEMNQIQARTQEKTEAEIKQFRRSLNFKANPMPSFYHENVVQRSENKKAFSANNKSAKLQSKSSTLGNKSAGSTPRSKVRNDRAVYANESVNRNDPPQASGSTTCSSAESPETSAISPTPTNRSCRHQDGAKSRAAKKKEREKNDTCSLKHGTPEASKATKGKQTEGKKKVGTMGYTNSTVRKDMKKRMSFGGDLGMGHIAVGVAS
ncbi:protein WVD2-like 7 isoform X2 [Malania oleifera]|uniref:protein WVD2-like 7 isoform X2 n=1 Tax=Malania oleifera TaxID=397392 RepID=UPI0025AE773A|nr:protein WVD2-like 7 isoform X2 [Malania oleifera]